MQLDSEPLRGIVLLNGENYHTWRNDIKVLLMDRGCYSFIDDSEPPYKPEEMSRREIQDYNQRKARCYSTIYYSLEPEYRLLINSAADGPSAWKILKDTFEQVSRARVIYLMDSFFSIRPAEGESISIFCARLKTAVSRLADAGHPLKEIYQAFQAIRYLPKDFQGIVQNIYRWEDSKFTFDNVEKELIIEESRLAQLKRDSGDVIEAQGAYGSSVSSYNRDVKSDSKCRDHSKSSKSVCRKPRYDKRIKNPKSKQIGPCFRCNEFGHLISNCPAKNSSSLIENRLEGNLATFHFHCDLEDPTTVFDQESFVIETVACQTEVQDKRSWVIDTGATGHFCNNRELFLDFKPINANISLAVNDAESKIMGIGTVLFTVYIKGQKRDIYLHNCMYSPNLRRNLLSGSIIEKNGCHFLGSSGKLTVYTPNGKKLFYGKRQGGLYFVKPVYYRKVEKPSLNVNVTDVKTRGSVNESKSETKSDSIKEDADLWHKRYGHINLDYIVKTSKDDAVQGLPNLKSSDFSCVSCKVAKNKRVSYNPIGLIRSKKPLELLHMDGRLWSFTNSKSFQVRILPVNY